MKYPKLKSGIIKKSVIDFFDSFPVKTANYDIFDARNAEFSGEISSRNGVLEEGNFFITSSNYYENEIIFTEAVYFKDNSYNRLFINSAKQANKGHYLNFSFISNKGEFANANSISYFADENGVLPNIININGFSGTSINGAGVFVIIGIEENGRFRNDIYEFSADLSEWILIGEEGMHIPTCLLNGKGNNFELSNLILPEEEYPEKVNLLNGRGNLFYTTDGFSTNFYMPIASEISNDEHIKVELQVDMVKKLKFVFHKNNYLSTSVTYKDYDIAIALEGDYLKIQSSPEGFAPPKIYGKENNMKVTINKNTLTLLRKKAFMEHIGWYPLSDKGSRLLLCGNSLYPDCAMVSSHNNLLYIPEGNEVYLGTNNQKTIAVAPFKNSVLLFKEHSIYKIQVVGETVKSICISDNIGALHPKTVKSKGKTVLFLGSDKKIYAVLENETIKEISKSFEDVLSMPEADFTFAMINANYYTLFIGNKAYRISLQDKNFEKTNVGIWDFPENCIFFDGFEYADKIILINYRKTSTAEYYSAVAFNDEDKDNYYIQNTSNTFIFNKPVEMKIKIRFFKTDKLKDKMLTKIALRGKSKNPVAVNIINENGDIVKTFSIDICNGDLYKTAYIYPLVCAKECIIELCAKGKTHIKAAEVEYYEM